MPNRTLPHPTEPRLAEPHRTAPHPTPPNHAAIDDRVQYHSHTVPRPAAPPHTRPYRTRPHLTIPRRAPVARYSPSGGAASIALSSGRFGGRGRCFLSIIFIAPTHAIASCLAATSARVNPSALVRVSLSNACENTYHSRASPRRLRLVSSVSDL